MPSTPRAHRESFNIEQPDSSSRRSRGSSWGLAASRRSGRGSRRSTRGQSFLASDSTIAVVDEEPEGVFTNHADENDDATATDLDDGLNESIFASDGTFTDHRRSAYTHIDGAPAAATVSAASVLRKTRTVGLLGSVLLLYFNVSGGPFGAEPLISSAGPLVGLVSMLVFPFVWSLQSAFVTAELSSAFPTNGGYSVWVAEAMGDMWGYQVRVLRS